MLQGGPEHPRNGQIPIGRPVANTEVFVMDENGVLVPPGVPGELWVGGPGLARGYWNRPELTEERFIKHPFSDDPQARVYRSGDVVRWRGMASWSLWAGSMTR